MERLPTVLPDYSGKHLKYATRHQKPIRHRSRSLSPKLSGCLSVPVCRVHKCSTHLSRAGFFPIRSRVWGVLEADWGGMAFLPLAFLLRTIPDKRPDQSTGHIKNFPYEVPTGRRGWPMGLVRCGDGHSA